MKYIKLFENYFASEEVENVSIDDLKMKLIDLLNEKFGGDDRSCTAESDPENENLFTIIFHTKQRWNSEQEPSIECEIKPYESNGREGYPNYVLYLKSDEISEETKGPWAFSEDTLNTKPNSVVIFIYEFLIGVRYKK